MASLDRPKLRLLSAQRFEHRGQPYVALHDPWGAFTDPVLIPLHAYLWAARHFDGATSLEEIRARIEHETTRPFPLSRLESLVLDLDRALVLEGPSFATYRTSYQNEQVRPAAFAGRSYARHEPTLRAQLDQFFAHRHGSGPPRVNGERPTPVARLRGILSPHIDFQRGGPVYTWSYKALVEQSDADTFVILGVAHQPCRHRFVLTRKDFATPLGVVETDRVYVDRIAALAGPEFFDDELAHRGEHSIEFQAVFLQYLLGGRRPFRIVPILVGSFHDLMEDGTDPIESEEVRRFVAALRAAEAESAGPVSYIGAIDLCHVGPEFGDPDRVDPVTLDRVRAFDATMLDHAAANDPKRWFGTAAEVGNRWRVCGLAATYTMLHAMGPARGRLLKYDQALDEQRTCCVSFASLAFDDITPCPEVRTRA